MVNPHSLISFYICYLTYPFILHESTQFRAAIGIAFIMLGLYNLLLNRNRVAIILFLISVSFHYSMLIFYLPFYLIYKNYTVLRSVSILLSYAVVCFLLFDPEIMLGINPLMSVYSEKGLNHEFNRYYLVVLYLIAFIGYLTIKSSHDRFSKFYWIVYFYLFSFAIALSNTPIIAVRVMDVGTVVALYFVHSLRFNATFLNKTLYLLIYILCLSRGYIFISTDTVYRFTQ